MTKEKHRDSADKDHLYENKKGKRLPIQTGRNIETFKMGKFQFIKSGRAHRAGQTALRLLDILGRLHLLSDLDVI